MANNSSNDDASRNRKRFPIVILMLLVLLLYFFLRPKTEKSRPENVPNPIPTAQNRKIRLTTVSPSDTAGVIRTNSPFIDIQRGGRVSNLSIAKRSQDTGTIIITGNGDTDFYCGSCEAQVGQNVPVESLQGRSLVKCNNCNNIGEYRSQ